MNNPKLTRALVLAPKVSGGFSMLGSALVTYDILRNDSKRKQSLFRIMLAMSVCDFVVSFWYFLSTWTIPPEDNFGRHSAVGTRATCNAQGFFLQFGIIVPIYNSILSVFYLLVIKFGWSEKKVRARAEPVAHCVAFVVSVSTAVAGIAMEIYSGALSFCYISGVPKRCEAGLVPCRRGDNAPFFRILFLAAPVAVLLILSTVCMAIVYWTVRKQDIRISRYSQGRKRRMSKAAAIQGISYLVPFYIAWLPFILFIAMGNKENNYLPSKWSLLAVTLLQPCQGFFNCIFYFRQRVVNKVNRWRQKRKDSKDGGEKECLPGTSWGKDKEKKPLENVEAEKEHIGSSTKSTLVPASADCLDQQHNSADMKEDIDGTTKAATSNQGGAENTIVIVPDETRADDIRHSMERRASARMEFELIKKLSGQFFDLKRTQLSCSQINMESTLRPTTEDENSGEEFDCVSVASSATSPV